MPLLVQTDSSYVISIFTEWLEGWERRGWRTAGNKPVANAEAIRQTQALLGGRDVQWQHVRGHAGHAENELADKHARDAATSAQNGQVQTFGDNAGHCLTLAWLPLMVIRERDRRRVSLAQAVRRRGLSRQRSPMTRSLRERLGAARPRLPARAGRLARGRDLRLGDRTSGRRALTATTSASRQERPPRIALPPPQPCAITASFAQTEASLPEMNQVAPCLAGRPLSPGDSSQ